MVRVEVHPMPFEPCMTRLKRRCQNDRQVVPPVEEDWNSPIPGTSRDLQNAIIFEEQNVEFYEEPQNNDTTFPSQAIVHNSDSQLNDDNSQMSVVSTGSTLSTKARRLQGILSVISTQKSCFICRNSTGRKRIPKQALTQVWMEKSILIPHENRCCAVHLVERQFTEEAMGLITATRNGVLMSDEELCSWIFQLSQLGKNRRLRRRYNFDDPQDISQEDYANLVGFPKEDFDFLLTEISGHVHNSSNRSPRNALAMFLMLLRHNLSQVCPTYR